MTRVAALMSVVGIALYLLLGGIAEASAHPWRNRDGYAYRTRIAYADMAPSYAGCRVGWWQGLAYGHVRPRWAAVCR